VPGERPQVFQGELIPPWNRFAPPGTNRSCGRGDEVGRSNVEVREGDLASVQVFNIKN
jgi:hypothetical protein